MRPPLFSDGDDYVARNDTAHYLDFAAHRRSPVLAVQFGVGLLSLRRAGTRRDHPSHPRADGTAVTPITLAKKIGNSVPASDASALDAIHLTSLTASDGPPSCRSQALWPPQQDDGKFVAVGEDLREPRQK